MLLRLIAAISLLVFALLLMAGAQIDLALYRTLIVFLVLFAGVYLSLFFINIIQISPDSKASATSAGTATGKNKTGNSGSESGKENNNKSS